MYTHSTLLLSAFVKVGILENLIDALVLPNKGTSQGIWSEIIDRKTRGPFIIGFAYNYRAEPIIGTVPESPEINTPPLFIQHPKVIKFQHNVSKRNDATITFNWIIILATHASSIKK